jgi:SAM-dependent methyltransferase
MVAKGEPRCLSCGAEGAEEFFAFSDLPVHVCLLWPTVEEARNCTRGEIRLAFCPRCGFIGNGAFRPELLAYAEGYENSLRFSEVFQGYIKSYAQDLVHRYELFGKNVVEIGCGDGEFLSLLCELGENRGIGFDPSYSEEKAEEPVHPAVQVIPDYYSEKYADVGADLIVCRQVFEHIPDPAGFLRDLRASISGGARTAVEFEVPNALYTLDNLSLWDVIYEHCSYFSRASLRSVFTANGFDVIHIGETYEDQFLSVGAVPAGKGKGGEEGGGVELEQVSLGVERFRRGSLEKVESWRNTIGECSRDGKRIALWGAGARGVSFLNMVEGGEELGCVVDINPRKHGAHLPGTGQTVMAPDVLRSYHPDLVVIMNPIYQTEIEKVLRDMGVDAEVRVA